VWRRVAVRERLERTLGLILVALGLEFVVDQR
jgi:small neutral amino acid transporter SnatA (MarC family)